MQGFLEFPGNNPSYPVSCEVAKGLYAPLIDPEETACITVSCNNPLRENIITCKDHYKEEFLQEVNGLELNVPLSTTQVDLPPYIPIVDYNVVRDGYPINHPVVGISLWDILSEGIYMKAGCWHESKEIKLREQLLMSPNLKGKKVILFNAGPDSLIESIWYRRNEVRLFHKLSNMGFAAVTGFNFSVFEQECAFAQALNIKRSMFSAHEMEKYEISIIPHVYAVNNYQTMRWINWFKKNQGVKYFTMNCQMQKSEHDIAQITATVKKILKHLPHLHVILQGFRIKELYHLDNFIERIHLADKIPAKYAQMGKEIIYNPEAAYMAVKMMSKKRKQFLFDKNLKSRLQYIEAIQQKNVIQFIDIPNSPLILQF